MPSNRPVLSALLAAVLFGAATPASKVLLAGLSPFQLAGLLYLGAAVSAAPAIAGAGKWGWPAERKNQLRLLGAVLFGGTLGPVFLLLGLQLASAASVSLWLNFELVATALLGQLFFHDHLGSRGWLAVLGMVIAGSILTTAEGSAGLSSAALVAAACVCWGLDNHLTALIDGITPSQSTFWKGLIAGTVNLTIGIAAAPFVGSSSVVLVGLLIGALSYGASIALYISAAQGIGATRAQMIFASAPFFGMAIATVVPGESISMIQVLSGVVFAASFFLLFQDRHAHFHVHEAMSHTHAHRHDDGHHTHVHPSVLPSYEHSHWHEHEPLSHAHPHWPDLHHRHVHAKPAERSKA
jgi:drug/metabolite transporter (DMT)-like permease